MMGELRNIFQLNSLWSMIVLSMRMCGSGQPTSTVFSSIVKEQSARQAHRNLHLLAGFAADTQPERIQPASPHTHTHTHTHTHIYIYIY